MDGGLIYVVPALQFLMLKQKVSDGSCVVQLQGAPYLLVRSSFFYDSGAAALDLYLIILKNCV